MKNLKKFQISKENQKNVKGGANYYDPIGGSSECPNGYALWCGICVSVHEERLACPGDIIIPPGNGIPIL